MRQERQATRWVAKALPRQAQPACKHQATAREEERGCPGRECGDASTARVQKAAPLQRAALLASKGTGG